MSLNPSHINNFCKYFIKKRNSYNNDINGHVIGPFKTNNKNSYNELAKDNVELNTSNFCQFFYNSLSNTNLDPGDLTHSIYLFLSDAIKLKPEYANSCSFTDDQILFFQNLINKSNEEYNELNISNPFIVRNTQSFNSIPSDTQIIQELDSLNSNDDSIVSKLDATIINRISNMENSLLSKLDDKINSRISSEFNKHLGVDKNLSSDQVTYYKNKLGYTYNSILRKENQIQILKSHLENKTTPEALSHHKFPVPFQAFQSNILYIDKYNKIVEKTQVDFINLEISQFKEDKDLLTNDIKVFKDILKYHIIDMDKLDREIYDQQNNILKKSFESATVKVSKMIAKPFVVKHHNNDNNNYNNNNNKPNIKQPKKKVDNNKINNIRQNNNNNKGNSSNYNGNRPNNINGNNTNHSNRYNNNNNNNNNNNKYNNGNGNRNNNGSMSNNSLTNERRFRSRSTNINNMRVNNNNNNLNNNINTELNNVNVDNNGPFRRAQNLNTVP